MNALPILSFYAAGLALVHIGLSAAVVRQCLAHEVSLGDGGHDDLQVAQRRLANFAEHVPIALILIALVEWNGAAPALVHALGATLVASRMLHPMGLGTEFGVRLPRVVGFSGTCLVLVAGASWLLWRSLA